MSLEFRFQQFYSYFQYIKRLFTWVKTAAAVDHDKHGINTNGFGQFVAARDAI